MLDQEKVQELYCYDAETGLLTNRIAMLRKSIGAEAGWVKDGIYRVVSIGGKCHYTHRIIWLYHYGKMPRNIDHINGDVVDNRLVNLRNVTKKQNLKNQKKSSANTSGHMGVYEHKESGRWRVRIKVNQKFLSLGYCDSFDEAVKVRKAAEKKYGFHKNHGR